MPRLCRKIGLLWIWIAVFSIPALVSMSTVEERSFDDALTILESAVESGDYTPVSDLIHEDHPVNIAGTEFSGNIFSQQSLRRNSCEFEIFDNGEITSVRTTLENFLWGDDGLFASLENVTLTHYEFVDRDEIQDDAIIHRWEHGELETAVVAVDDYTFNLYVLPEMRWRLTFERFDGDWYLTAIAARAG